MAGDLRDVVAALKISGVVERIGDYAKNIAKRVPQLEGAAKIEPLSLLPEMARIATGMVHDVLVAHSVGDRVSLATTSAAAIAAEARTLLTRDG